VIRLTQPFIDERAIEEISEVLKSGMLVQGEYVKKFEDALREYMSAKYVLAVSSGTAALHLALVALDIKEGDAVIVPAFTFPATANVVELQRARPVLVDVDIRTYNIDLEQLEKTIKNWKGPEKLKAIVVVHEFGAPCNMDEIISIARKYNLYLIEDAACALGAKYKGQHVGTFGDIGCFSWHPRKAITTGEGGALVVNNEEMFNKLSLLRNHGICRKDDGSIDFLLPGYNYRLTEFQAVLGLNQLGQFDCWLERRREIVKLYYHKLADIGIQLPDDIEGHAWQTFMVVLPEHINRTSVIKKLKQENIETNLGAQALHMLSYYSSKYDYVKGDFLNSAILYERGLAIPLHPFLQENEINAIVTSLKKVLLSG
jgi:perosamine synthetase